MKPHNLLTDVDNMLRCEDCGLSWKNPPKSQCPGVKVYGWGKWPENLLTKKQMSDAGLQTGKKLPAPAGAVYRDKSPDGIMWLYDKTQGTPKKPASTASKAAGARLQAGWTCQRCGDRLHRFLQNDGYCDACDDHRKVVGWAREMLDETPSALILDTETTGLDAEYNEIVQIAVIDTLGCVLLDTFIQVQNPERMFEGSPSAHAIHGITLADIAGAPTWADVYPRLVEIIGKRPLLIYNSAFDVAMIRGDCRRHGLPMPEFDDYCMMTWYAAWYGQWSHYWNDYRWQPLDGGHRALDDCRATLKVLLEMSKQ